MKDGAIGAGVLALGLLVCGCQAEKRQIAASQPSSAPVSAEDPRGRILEANAYQVSQGQRLFRWFGCIDCHGTSATGRLDLADDRWLHGARPGEVYRSIAAGPAHAYGAKAVDEYLWQLTAYVRRMRDMPADKRRRQDADSAAEPQAGRWTGAQP